MQIMEKTNLEWLYEEYVMGLITEGEINDILKDFGYDLKTRIALLELMRDKKEDEELDEWVELAEQSAEANPEWEGELCF